jgi:hypothetical protein
MGMQTVVETPAFLSAADDAGMTEAERKAVVDLIAANPEAGEIMPGTGGCRKVRVAGRGKGKSGGYRLITYYVTTEVPVFLLTVFSKGERANLSKAERNALAVLAKRLLTSLKAPA